MADEVMTRDMLTSRGSIWSRTYSQSRNGQDGAPSASLPRPGPRFRWLGTSDVMTPCLSDLHPHNRRAIGTYQQRAGCRGTPSNRRQTLYGLPLPLPRPHSLIWQAFYNESCIQPRQSLRPNQGPIGMLRFMTWRRGEVQY
jgi:hypothetical protein